MINRTTDHHRSLGPWNWRLLFLLTIACRVSFVHAQLSAIGNYASAPLPIDSVVATADFGGCCSYLRLDLDESDQWPTKIFDYGGYYYLLSNVATGETGYGSLAKYHPNGKQIWRYTTDFTSVFYDAAITEDGFILISGQTTYTVGGVNNRSLVLRIAMSDGTEDWIKSYDQGGFERFPSILYHPHPATTGQRLYVLGETQAQSGNEFFATLFRTSTTLTNASSARYYSFPGINGTTVGDHHWKKLIPLTNGNILAVGEVELSGTQGVIFELTATGSFVRGAISDSDISYTNATILSDGNIVVAGTYPEAISGNPTAALWLFSANLQPYDRISWPEDFDTELTGLTSTTINDEPIIYVSGSNSVDEAIIIKLSIGLSFGQTLTATRTASAQAMSSPTDYYFIHDEAYRIDTTAGRSINGRIAISRNGQRLLYAHARVANSNTVAHNILFGHLPLSLDLSCLKPITLYPQSATTFGLSSRSVNVDNTILTSPASLSGQWSTDISSTSRCSPDVVDGCQTTYPVRTSGYFKIPPLDNCTQTSLEISVIDNQGRVLYTQTIDATQDFVSDLTDAPRGLYFIRFADPNTGEILHTSSVQLV